MSIGSCRQVQAHREPWIDYSYRLSRALEISNVPEVYFLLASNRQLRRRPAYNLAMTQDSVRKDEILLSSTGRPPWYTPAGKAVPSYVIGIAGGSASGKTHVATSILRQLNHIPACLILSQDSFYNKLNAEKHALAHKNELDLDAPDAIDMKIFAQVGRNSMLVIK